MHGIREMGSQKSASLLFRLRGGPLGEVPVSAGVSGYGESAEEAIITGACNWACVFGPVLETALTNSPVPQDTELTVFETTIDGRPYRVVLDGLDRAMTTSGEGEPEPMTADARKHLGAVPWLIPKVLASGLLPVLPAERASVVSVFCWEAPDQRTLEVKVNGVDWPDGAELLDTVPYWEGPGVVLLRELAVVVPLDTAAPLTRSLVPCRSPAAEEHTFSTETLFRRAKDARC